MQSETITISKSALLALAPCADRMLAVGSKLTDGATWNAADAVAAGATLSDLVWVTSALSRSSPDVERRLRLWMADCVARVAIHNPDSRVSAAIVAARLFARGQISSAELAAAEAAARSAWAAAAAAWAARSAAAAEARSAWAAAWAARSAAEAAAAAAWAARSAAEELWQLTRLVEWLSANEPDDWPLPVVASENAA